LTAANGASILKAKEREVLFLQKQRNEIAEENLKYLTELPLLFLTGGVGYYVIELLWRGRSHWSMALCGALAFLFIYRLNEAYPHAHLLFCALQSALFITGLELAAGCVLNLWLGFGIWDYSGMPYQILGQICLPYSLLWVALCIPVCILCRWMRRVIFLADD
jgi:hypothetical protein